MNALNLTTRLACATVAGIVTLATLSAMIGIAGHQHDDVVAQGAAAKVAASVTLVALDTSVAR